ncbi:TPA: hypothetical protein DD394_02925 [bacterium UBP9_UBA11836]|nr:hypothetical protein [bacterium UBP9_UBA11836]
MKAYKKPRIAGTNDSLGFIPALAVAGLSVGGAFAAGVASGLMKDKRYDDFRLKPLKKVEA